MLPFQVALLSQRRHVAAFGGSPRCWLTKWRMVCCTLVWLLVLWCPHPLRPSLLKSHHLSCGSIIPLRRCQAGYFPRTPWFKSGRRNLVPFTLGRWEFRYFATTAFYSPRLLEAALSFPWRGVGGGAFLQLLSLDLRFGETPFPQEVTEITAPPWQVWYRNPLCNLQIQTFISVRRVLSQGSQN